MNKTLAAGILSALILGSCARPVAEFRWVETSDRRAPAAILFDNKSQHAETYIWDFGDGQTSREAAPRHLFAEAGNYLVTLEARSGDQVSRQYQRIEVIGPDACLVEIATPFGDMIVELYDATPLHRDNFMKLVREGFYDDLLFHRVIKGFMIQGGDPNSRDAAPDKPLGSGGPGYTIPAEFVDTLVHLKGALAAARTGDQVNPEKRSSGSQFYIVDGRQVSSPMLGQVESRYNFRYHPRNKEAYLRLGGTPQLDQNYTVFGRVVSGLNVIDEIANAQTDNRDRPTEDVTMKMRIIHYFPDKKKEAAKP